MLRYALHPMAHGYQISSRIVDMLLHLSTDMHFAVAWGTGSDEVCE